MDHYSREASPAFFMDADELFALYGGERVACSGSTAPPQRQPTRLAIAAPSTYAEWKASQEG